MRVSAGLVANSWEMWQHCSSVATKQTETQRKADLETAITAEYDEGFFSELPTYIQYLTAWTKVEQTVSISRTDQETRLKHVQPASVTIPKTISYRLSAQSFHTPFVVCGAHVVPPPIVGAMLL